jgi:hypothetical protein
MLSEGEKKTGKECTTRDGRRGREEGRKENDREEKKRRVITQGKREGRKGQESSNQNKIGKKWKRRLNMEIGNKEGEATL